MNLIRNPNPVYRRLLLGPSEGNKLVIPWYIRKYLKFLKLFGFDLKILERFFLGTNFEFQVISSLLENTLNSHNAIFTLFLFSKNQPNLN